MLLACQQISKTYFAEPVLKDVSFHLEANEKTALTASTIRQINTAEDSCRTGICDDSGSSILPKDCRIGYLPQIPEIEGNETIYEVLAGAKKHIFEMEASLRSMGGRNASSDRQFSGYADAILYQSDAPL